MKLIYTNDGLIGLCFPENPTIWCKDVAEATRIMYGQFSRYSHISTESINIDISCAINSMRKFRHDVAEFGCLGTLLFTHNTEGEA